MKRLLLLLFLLIPASYLFALEQPTTLETLVQDSEKIIRGKVVARNMRPGTNEFGDELIYTDVHISPIETLKGQHLPVIVTVEGGTANGVKLVVSDSPEFEANSEVIVFVKKKGSEDRLVSPAHGKFTVMKDGRIKENNIHYREFRRMVHEVVERGKRK